MNDFDAKARQWDNDKMHWERSRAIAAGLEKKIPDNRSLSALEYGAGTGILSFLLKDKFHEIVLMDSSEEMIRVCKEKVSFFNASHIKPLWFNLEEHDYEGKFDIIYCQMVLHHVKTVDLIFEKFTSMLNRGGILAIADLYPEDGSFHGLDIDIHLGFDPIYLIGKLEKLRFGHAEYKSVFTIKRPSGIDYPVFLMTVVKL